MDLDKFGVFYGIVIYIEISTILLTDIIQEK